MIVNVRHIKSYPNADIFMKERGWEKCKEVFTDVEDLDLEGEGIKDERERITALFEHLNSLDWSDEEIILTFLRRDKEKWFLHYDDKTEGFVLYEVMG